MKGAWNIVFVLVVASLTMGMIQLALIFLLLAGLIFRTRETIGALTFLFVLGILEKYLWAGVSILALIVVLAMLPSRPQEPTSAERRLLPPPR